MTTGSHHECLGFRHFLWRHLLSLGLAVAAFLFFVLAFARCLI